MTAFATVYLNHVTYALGAPRSIAELEELRDDPERLRTMRAHGLREYRASEGGLTQLAVEAGARCLESAGVDPVSIETVLFVSSSLDDAAFGLEPLTEIARELELERAQPLGVTMSECASLAAGLRVGGALLVSGAKSPILVMAVDGPRPGRSRILPPNVSVMSDAAAACLLGTDARAPFRLAAVEQCVDHRMGRGMGLLELSFSEAAAYMHRTRDNLRRVCDAAMSAAQAPVDRFKLLVTNNYNDSLTRGFAQVTGIGLERTFADNLSRLGHALTCDGLINLADAQSSVPWAQGDLALILCSGPNTWGAIVLERVLPD